MNTGKKVLFVATAEARDEEMRQRIEEHKHSRPSSWVTLEVTHNLGQEIPEKAQDTPVIIIDDITLLVSNIFGQAGEQMDAEAVEKQVAGEINSLTDCMDKTGGDYIIVTNEVGLGLVPANEMGRLYRDILGRANSTLADYADEVIIMVSGIPVKVKPSL